MVWNSAYNSIRHTVETKSPLPGVSKRSISSEIAKIYDLLWFLGPVIIVAKNVLQKIWTLMIDWDESLPMAIHTEGMRYCAQLPLLNNFQFQRKTIINKTKNRDIHGFCDVSERAYGPCICLRSVDKQGHIQVELLIAKSKVAILKSQSIPRLELCGSLLLTSLMIKTRQVLQLECNRTVVWTDSTIFVLFAALHNKTFWLHRTRETVSTPTISTYFPITVTRIRSYVATVRKKFVKKI
ncbi:uncharacterized protein LOC143431807 [Xylocopa sonorina]|uniref:uncharacterized protein LOC143431807 n=1 Tax=Xylocopa sonorina TaxID=1818115 RepID=UPI00403B2E09